MPSIRTRFAERVFARDGRQCVYCGETDCYLTMDHFVPLDRGGKTTFDNLVPACGVCNSIKGNRTIEKMRHALLLRALGWPKFSVEEIAWLRTQGFDLRRYDIGQLWFERQLFAYPRLAAQVEYEQKNAQIHHQLQNGVNHQHAVEMPINAA